MECSQGKTYGEKEKKIREQEEPSKAVVSVKTGPGLIYWGTRVVLVGLWSISPHITPTTSIFSLTRSLSFFPYQSVIVSGPRGD